VPKQRLEGSKEVGENIMKRTMTPIDLVEHNFDKWIFGGIEALAESEGVCLTFVIIACAIDYLAGFNYGGDTTRHTKEAYTDFLKEYGWFIKKYNPEDVYDSLRCGLVHNFTIHEGKFSLTHKHPELHLKTHKGQIILNFEDFYGDFKRLKEEYFKKVNDSKSGKTADFMKRYETLGFLATEEEMDRLIDL